MKGRSQKDGEGEREGNSHVAIPAHLVHVPMLKEEIGEQEEEEERLKEMKGEEEHYSMLPSAHDRIGALVNSQHLPLHACTQVCVQKHTHG